MDPLDPLLILDEVAVMTRLPVATLRYLRHCGTGPRSGKLGRRVVYRESDVLRWIDEQFAKDARNGSIVSEDAWASGHHQAHQTRQLPGSGAAQTVPVITRRVIGHVGQVDANLRSNHDSPPGPNGPQPAPLEQRQGEEATGGAPARAAVQSPPDDRTPAA